MKALLLTAFLFLQLASAISQDAATGMNSRRVPTAKPRGQWLMRYEKVDTIDSRTGRKISVNIAYYFNKKGGNFKPYRFKSQTGGMDWL